MQPRKPAGYSEFSIYHLNAFDRLFPLRRARRAFEERKRVKHVCQNLHQADESHKSERKQKGLINATKL